MIIKPIKTQRDYQQALKEIDKLMDATPNSPEGDRLDLLATLVSAWEDRHFPIDPPDPVSAILFAMEQRGLSAPGPGAIHWQPGARDGSTGPQAPVDSADDPPTARRPGNPSRGADQRTGFWQAGVTPLFTNQISRACSATTFGQ